MEFPTQEANSLPSMGSGEYPLPGKYDLRDHLIPRRLTLAMWDQAFLLRHIPGGSYEDYDRVLDEAIERGYNTLRLDPLPQLLDLAQPEKVISFPDPQTPYMPWCWDTAVEGPVGEWLVDFMEKLLRRNLYYTLSAWWFSGSSSNNRFPAEAQAPGSHLEAAQLWTRLLGEWQKRFGFDGLVYVDLANEVPYFLPDFMARFQRETGAGWGDQARFNSRQVAFLKEELASGIGLLQREFPSLRFTASIHGDLRWLDVPLTFDCLDAHFYAESDPRWSVRTCFHDYMDRLFTDTGWYAEFSQRCTLTSKAVAPMLRARQRGILSAFAGWSARHGMPLTTSESWASWYYIDSPDLDWGWLLDWAEWSVEDAIEFKMWGWTPHNYVQPQFANWRDVRWHRRLTERFLNS
jgi:hypothetical protein